MRSISACYRLARTSFRFAFAAGILSGASAATAQTFTVGADGACSTNSLQLAINAAGDGDVVRIARNQTYSAQALLINGRDLTLIGGYADCSATTPAGLTVLSGQGGGSDSVLTIRGSARVTLENLNLIRGDEVSDGYGGGLDVRASGTVTLINTAVTQNYAGYGGGISAISEGGALSLVLRAESVVQLNVAQFSGGGIRIEGNVTLRAIDDRIWIANNEARGINPSNNQPQFGNGGGIQILAPARAEIGSPGYGSSGVVFGNSARYGGGIAVDGRVDAGQYSSASLLVFTTDPARATRIHGNLASQTGGGIHLLPDAESFFPYTRSSARACLWDARVDDNTAQQGSAVYADTDFATLNNVPSSVVFNSQPGNTAKGVFGTCGTRPAAAVDCLPGVPCSTIDGNFAQTSAAQASAATVLVQDGGSALLRRVSLRDNFGSELLRATDDAAIEVHGVLATGSNLTGSAIRVNSGVRLQLSDTTIAGNIIGNTHVVVADGAVDFLRNLVWQPGRRVIAAGGSVTVASSIVNDLAGFPPGPEALVVEPRFVDPIGGDYSLRAASPAIDFAPATSEDDVDVLGGTRDRDLDLIDDLRGPRDVGALERQSIDPLILNPRFDTDVRLWDEVTSGASQHDPMQDASASAQSGALAVNTTALTQGRVIARSQCIHLPGPGRYLLNGSGRTTGSLGATRDLVVLRWEFRRNGGEACIGTVDRSNELIISSSNSWQRAATSADISVSAAEWTNFSSIVVSLVVVDRAISGTPTAVGWFDDITLTAGSLIATNLLFANGFE
jgi:hypothetical protein